MAWLKVSFAPVSAATGACFFAGGFARLGLAALEAARLAGRETLVFLADVFFAVAVFFINRPPTRSPDAAQVWSGAAAIVKLLGAGVASILRPRSHCADKCEAAVFIAGKQRKLPFLCRTRRLG